MISASLCLIALDYLTEFTNIVLKIIFPTLLVGKIMKVLFLAYLFPQSEEQEMYSISLR